MQSDVKTHTVRLLIVTKYLRERAETYDKNPFWYWGDLELAGVNDTRLYFTFEGQDDTVPNSRIRTIESQCKDSPNVSTRMA